MGAPDRNDVVGHHLGTSLGLLDLDGAPVAWGEHPLAQALQGHEVGPTRLTVDRGGERRHVLTSARPLPVAGSTGAVIILRDVTASVEEERRLTELALRDPLTGLGNRHLLQDHLERLLRNDRDPRSCCAVILLDLDGFKDVNDRYGHAVGDDVLVLVARRIEHALRASELVARLGGDEFVVACEDVAHSEVELMGERLRKALASPLKVGEHVLTIGASIGWATSDRRADTRRGPHRPSRRRDVPPQGDPPRRLRSHDRPRRRPSPGVLRRPARDLPSFVGWPASVASGPLSTEEGLEVGRRLARLRPGLLRPGAGTARQG